MSNPIHKDEFPREKLIKHGPSYLSNYELLAILLNTGTKKENVLELSEQGLRIEMFYLRIEIGTN